jgi:hypothetical protein
MLFNREYFLEIQQLPAKTMTTKQSIEHQLWSNIMSVVDTTVSFTIVLYVRLLPLLPNTTCILYESWYTCLFSFELNSELILVPKSKLAGNLVLITPTFSTPVVNQFYALVRSLL